MKTTILNALLAAVAVGCQACATVDADAASPPNFQYARDVGAKEVLMSGFDKGEMTVVWHFGSREWVNNMCGGEPGRTDVSGCSMNDANSDRCVMFLVAPKDFQDRDHLAVLGHELWHCQGARHS